MSTRRKPRAYHGCARVSPCFVVFALLNTWGASSLQPIFPGRLAPPASPHQPPPLDNADGSRPRVGAWLPVASTSALGGFGPTRVEVLGQRLVCWQPDAASRPAAWSVLEDVCAHRFAPLSQGRVDKLTGCIECPYHGWQYNDTGRCTKIPQRPPETVAADLPANAVVASLDTRVTGDVLWAFFDSRASSTVAGGASSGGEALPFELFPDVRFPMLKNASHTYARELPYSFDFLVENLMVRASRLPVVFHSLLKDLLSVGLSLDS